VPRYTARWRAALSLGAAALALLGAISALTDRLVLVPVVLGLLIPAAAFALLIGAYRSEGDWSTRRRWACVALAVCWASAAFVLRAITFAIPGCVCPDAETSTAVVSARTVVDVAYVGGPILLLIAAALPGRAGRVVPPVTGNPPAPGQ
jgi:hypothetical protein